MRIHIYMSHEEMSQMCAREIETKIREKDSLTLGLATGGTPMQLYDCLIEGHRSRHVTYQNVTTFNLDEYVGLPKEHPQSYHHFMWKHLFQAIDLPASHIHIPNGMAASRQQECSRYEKVLINQGPVDIQILGIGTNGHIGFNEPGTPLDSVTHEVKLQDSTRRNNSRFFSSLEEVPTHAITMGIQSILRSKEIYLLASGEKKAQALYRLFTEEPSVDFPASWLHLHPNVTVFADQAASHLLAQSAKC